MPRQYSSLQERLEAHREIDSETGCWLWTGHLDRGHGRITIERKPYLVGRIAMKVYRGFDLKSSKLICHIRECPNAHCFNPDHLYYGDHSSNLRDAIAIGKFLGKRKV